MVGMAGMTGAIVIIGWIASLPIMKLLGPGFLHAIPAFRWILISCFVWALAGPFYVLLTMSGKEALMAKILWIQVCITVGASIALVPSFGADGAAWAWVIGASAAALMTILAGIRGYSACISLSTIAS